MLGGIHHNFYQWCNYLWVGRESSLDCIWLHLEKRFPCKSVISFSEYLMQYKPADTPLSFSYSIEDLSHSFHVWARKRKGNAESFSTSWPLGIDFCITFLGLDKSFGAIESYCISNPPFLSFLSTLVLVLIPCITSQTAAHAFEESIPKWCVGFYCSVPPEITKTLWNIDHVCVN